MVEVDPVLVEPVLGGRVVPGGEQVLQHEDLVDTAALSVAIPFFPFNSIICDNLEFLKYLSLEFMNFIIIVISGRRTVAVAEGGLGRLVDVG